MDVVEQVRITPCTADHLVQWGLQLRQAPRIHDLEFDARDDRSPMTITQQEEAPHALRLLPDAWLRTEGRHSMRKPELTRLRVTDLNMRTAGQIWFDYLALDNLSCLSLELCNGVANFLIALRSNDLRSLRTLEIIHLGTGSLTRDDPTVESIDERLMHIKPGALEDLILRVHRAQNEIPSATAINRHASTLRTLVLEITGHGDTYELWTIQSLQGILDGCNALLELATSIGSYSVEESESDRADSTANTSFDMARVISDCCPRLKTLNLLNWPLLYGDVPYRRDAHTSRCELNPISLSATLPVAKHVAAFIFEIHRNEYGGGLEVLALGARDYSKPPPKYYVPCEEVVIRKKILSAGLVSLQQLKREDEHELQDLQERVQQIMERHAESAEDGKEDATDGETTPAERAAAEEDVDMAMAD